VVVMRAKPVRMLLLPGLVFLLVVGAGWSLAQAHGNKKTPAHKRARTALGQPQRQRLTPRPDQALEDNDSDQAAKPDRTKQQAKPAKPAKRARTASSAVTVTTHPPASVNLSAGWRSVPDPSNLGVAEDWGQGGGEAQPWQPVQMPNDFNATVAGAPNSGTVAWYETEFTGPLLTPGRAWRIAFESVRRNAQVWLNGYNIGSNSDPYAPFSLPATTLLPGQKNLLIVRVDNIRNRDTLPEDWWDWGGIMGPVTLEPVGRLTLTNLGVMPELSCRYRCGDLLVQGKLSSRTLGSLASDVVVTVTAPNGASSTSHHHVSKLGANGATQLNFRVPVRRPVALWSPRSPALYRVRVDVVAGGRVEQTQSLKVGMRSVEVHKGLLYLNGRRLWLHGASIHEDIAGHGAALTDADIATIVSELKAVGANVTRTHYLLSPRLLDALDTAGILVWAQAPVDHADRALRSSRGRANALRLLSSTLLGDRNHPSVMVDSVGNELSPNPDATPGTKRYLLEATALARQLNPTLPVGLDTYCYTGYPAQKIYSQLNVLGISHYFGWYTGPPGHSIVNFNGLRPFLILAHKRYPNLAVTVSEFGAEALFDGPATTKGSYAFQSNYIQQTFGVLDRLPFMNGAIYWTLREFAVGPNWTGGVTLPAGMVPDGIHHKGLIAYGGAPKPAFAVAQRLFGVTPSFVK
jgi:Glycosyl hydrolases family 2, TIM barrel domain/Glycosyl hydrolases family 2, sugar binding domain/Glycosyl hydrolases family 2